MLEAARHTLDADERKKLYAQVKETVVRDLPYISLYYGAEFAARTRKLHGFVWMPDNIPRFRSAWKAA